MSGEIIRQASYDELCRSFEASLTDGGTGVITVDGVDCFVDTDPDESTQRKIFGDCRSCVELGNTSPGLASERAVWVDAEGNVSEDVYHVCPECLVAGHGSYPGYRRA
jgi:hypothetical protein